MKNGGTYLETLLVLKFLREESSPLGQARPTLAPLLLAGTVLTGGAAALVVVGFGGAGLGVTETTGLAEDVGTTTLVEDALTEETGLGLQRLLSARFFFARSWWWPR